jgi:hypothetical protein
VPFFFQMLASQAFVSDELPDESTGEHVPGFSRGNGRSHAQVVRHEDATQWRVLT